ncbi:uncharacterized protein RB166_014717, partial [Leptodactylus fuscus]
LGHSYVFWAAQRAEVRPGGRSLGFREMEVEWRGIRGLKWCQVLPEAISIGQAAPPPVILVIHAGGNDLCVLRVAELLTLMRADMERIASYFSEVILVWSEMIPRVTWQGARDAAAVERARRTVNARLSRFVRSKGWVVVRHRQLEGDNRRLMRADGVHLNEIGLDIFLSGLQDGVEQALFLLGGGGSEPSVILWSPPWRSKNTRSFIQGKKYLNKKNNPVLTEFLTKAEKEHWPPLYYVLNPVELILNQIQDLYLLPVNGNIQS